MNIRQNLFRNRNWGENRQQTGNHQDGQPTPTTPGHPSPVNNVPAANPSTAPTTQAATAPPVSATAPGSTAGPTPQALTSVSNPPGNVQDDLYTQTFNQYQQSIGSAARIEAYLTPDGRTAYRYVGTSPGPEVVVPPQPTTGTGGGGTGGGGGGGGTGGGGGGGGTGGGGGGGGTGGGGGNHTGQAFNTPASQPNSSASSFSGADTQTNQAFDYYGQGVPGLPNYSQNIAQEAQLWADIAMEKHPGNLPGMLGSIREGNIGGIAASAAGVAINAATGVSVPITDIYNMINSIARNDTRGVTNAFVGMWPVIGGPAMAIGGLISKSDWAQKNPVQAFGSIISPGSFNYAAAMAADAAKAAGLTPAQQQMAYNAVVGLYSVNGYRAGSIDKIVNDLKNGVTPVTNPSDPKNAYGPNAPDFSKLSNEVPKSDPYVTGNAPIGANTSAYSDSIYGTTTTNPDGSPKSLAEYNANYHPGAVTSEPIGSAGGPGTGPSTPSNAPGTPANPNTVTSEPIGPMGGPPVSTTGPGAGGLTSNQTGTSPYSEPPVSSSGSPTSGGRAGSGGTPDYMSQHAIQGLLELGLDPAKLTNWDMSMRGTDPAMTPPSPNPGTGPAVPGNAWASDIIKDMDRQAGAKPGSNIDITPDSGMDTPPPGWSDSEWANYLNAAPGMGETYQAELDAYNASLPANAGEADIGTDAGGTPAQDSWADSTVSDVGGWSDAGSGIDTGSMNDSSWYAKGGQIKKPKGLMGNPPGPDDQYIGAQSEEYMIKKSAVKKYGKGFFDRLNAEEIHPKHIKGIMAASPKAANKERLQK